MNMTPGANATVPSQTLTIRIQSGMAVDASAFRLYDTGKVKNDADMVFYGQTTNDDQTISFRPEGNNSLFTVDLNRLHPSVQKLHLQQLVTATKPLLACSVLLFKLMLIMKFC